MSSLVTFFGLKFSTISVSELISRINDETPEIGVAYHLVNSYTLAIADESPNLFRILKEDVLICDGKPLALTLRRKNSKLMQIRGADLMRGVLSQKSSINARHYFLGSSDQVLEKLIYTAKRNNPQIKIVGSHSPEFRDDFQDLIPIFEELIRASGASIVWIGLGTPKQDFVAHDLAMRLPLNFLAVGAAFDYLSGNLSEAPRFLQKIGFEWLFRLVKEPDRLAQRYLIGNYKFLRILLRKGSFDE